MVARGWRAIHAFILDEYRKLSAYVARGEARPAYKLAFEAQLAVNARTPAPSAPAR